MCPWLLYCTVQLEAEGGCLEQARLNIGFKPTQSLRVASASLLCFAAQAEVKAKARGIEEDSDSRQMGSGAASAGIRKRTGWPRAW